MRKLLVAAQASLLVCALMTVAIVLALLAGEARDLSAWVQAVGSIAALFIAIFVMARQNRSAARLLARQNRHATRLVADADRLATVRRARSVQAVLRRTHNQLQQIERDLVTPPQAHEAEGDLASRFRAANTMFVRLKRTVDAVPAFDLGSYDMADGVLQLVDGLEVYEGLLQIASREPQSAGDEYMKRTMSIHRPTIDDAIAKFEKGLAELMAAGR